MPVFDYCNQIGDYIATFCYYKVFGVSRFADIHEHSHAVLWDRSQLNSTSTSRISLILTLDLGFASASCNIKDILLVVHGV